MHPKFKKHFERKQLPNGKKNPKYVDLLNEDPDIDGQTYSCFSFISPEDHIKRKEQFMFEEFVHQWDFNKSMEKFDALIHMFSFKYNIPYETLQKDTEEFVKEESASLHFTVAPEFKTFIERNEERLEKQYMEENKFQTCVRGLKLRGVYATEEAAQGRLKELKEIDPNHDIFIGCVGKWMPFHPDAYKTGRVQYMEEELNQLMSEKIKNDKSAKDAFKARVAESKERAMEENRKMAEKTGNVLTQTLTDEGELAAIETFVDKMGKPHNINTLQTDIREAAAKEAAVAVGDISERDVTEKAIKGVIEDLGDVVSGRTDHGQSRLQSGPYAGGASSYSSASANA